MNETASVASRPLLLEHYAPRYDITEVDAVVVNADVDTTWQAIRHGDLSRSLVIRALLELRSLPVRLGRLINGLPPEPARPPLTLDDMPRAGFLLLAEEPGVEIVFGQISRPWKASATTDGTPALKPEEFAEFDAPGYAKIAFNIRVEPYGSGRTLITTETRTATTDPASRRQFGKYWRLIGPFSGLIRRLMLRLVKSGAERQAGVQRSG